MNIHKSNPDYKCVEKDLKAIKQLFHTEDVSFRFSGTGFDSKTKDVIFAYSGIACTEFKYTERCTSKIMFYAPDIDGEAGWIIPDEHCNFELTYTFKSEVLL